MILNDRLLRDKAVKAHLVLKLITSCGTIRLQKLQSSVCNNITVEEFCPLNFAELFYFSQIGGSCQSISI